MSLGASGQKLHVNVHQPEMKYTTCHDFTDGADSPVRQETNNHLQSHRLTEAAIPLVDLR